MAGATTTIRFILSLIEKSDAFFLRRPEAAAHLFSRRR